MLICCWYRVKQTRLESISATSLNLQPGETARQLTVCMLHRWALLQTIGEPSRNSSFCQLGVPRGRPETGLCCPKAILSTKVSINRHSNDTHWVHCMQVTTRRFITFLASRRHYSNSDWLIGTSWGNRFCISFVSGNRTLKRKHALFVPGLQPVSNCAMCLSVQVMCMCMIVQ